MILINVTIDSCGWLILSSFDSIGNFIIRDGNINYNEDLINGILMNHFDIFSIERINESQINSAGITIIQFYIVTK